MTENDASGFDKNITKGDLVDAFVIFRKCFQEDVRIDRLFRFISRNFIEKVLVLQNGTVAYLDRGIPSGSVFTSIIGSIANGRIWYKLFNKCKAFDGIRLDSWR